MSSRIEPFECRWRVSPILLAASLALWALALLSILLAALPVWLKPPLALVCLAYGACGLYRQVLLRGSRAFRACAMTSGAGSCGAPEAAGKRCNCALTAWRCPG